MPFLPRKKMPMVFSTSQACEYMGISPDTLRRYRGILGIHPRKIYGVRGRFYLLPELIEMLNLRVPDERLYRAGLLDRYEAMRKDRENKKGTED